MHFSIGIVNHGDILAHLNTSHNELDLDKLRFILQYLHRTGIIMWYSDITDLKDMVFVKPSFLISLLKVCYDPPTPPPTACVVFPQ